jgi:hypothetical protein
VRFKRAKLRLAAGKLTKVNLRLAPKQSAAVRRVLRKQSLEARVILAVKDAAANRTTRTLTLKLSR